MITLVTGDCEIDPVAVENVVGAAPLIMTASPVGDSETIDPSIVITPPADRVCVPMTRLEFASSVNVEEPMTTPGIVDVGVGDGKVITSPLAVIAPPGKRVCDPITNPDAESAVILDPPRTTTPGGVLVGDAALIIIAPAELAETTWPPAVMADPRTRV